MSVRTYLPSTQFSLLVTSLFASVTLVYAAQYITKPKTPSTLTSSSNQAAVQTSDWQSALKSIQEQSGASLPTPPDPSTVNTMLKAAQTDNVTNSVGRSLLVNLTNAKAQGLGDDIPTQNQLIAGAASQVGQEAPTKTYAQNDLMVVEDTKDSLHAYGNALALAFAKQTTSDYADTMIAVDYASSQNDPTQLEKLKVSRANYDALTKYLLKIPVPKTFTPFHLQLVNNFQKITDSYTDMGQLLSDPLRGLAGIQTYKSLTQETLQVFINIAQSLTKDGILFTKDEPGASWSGLLSVQQ